MSVRGVKQTETETFPWVGLIVISLAVFASVTTEFLPTGLLPDMARELEVSQSQIGLLVTIFAGTVVVTAAPLAALTRRFSRKYLVIVVLLIVALGSVLTAIAPTYEVIIGARIIGGLAHGLFWAVVGAYAAHLVPPHQLGRAVAITSAGVTAAFVLGVPLGTAIGHLVGWRLAFVVIGVLLVVLSILVLKFLPAVDHRVPVKTGEIPLPMHRDRTIPAVAIVCTAVILVMTAHNTFYTFIAPYLIEVTRFEEDAVPVILFLFGGGGAIGLVLAGLLADRLPRLGMIVAFSLVAVSVAVLAVFSGNHAVVIAAIVVWGIAFGSGPVMLQARMLRAASARVRDLASAFFTTSFNVAIGGGALIGAILLDSFGLRVLPAVSVGIMVVGVVFLIGTDAWLRRRDTAYLRARGA